MPRFTTLLRSSQLRLAGAVAALAVAVPVTAVSDAQPQQQPREQFQQVPCNGPRSKVLDQGSGKWQQFRAPTFESAVDLAGAGIPVSQDIASFAVGPSNASVVAVTNGNSVYVSRDGGCSWALGYQLDPVKSTTRSVIRGVYIAPATSIVYALVEEIELGVAFGKPSIARSGPDGRGPWQETDSGLPPIGRPLLMRGHANGEVLYLTFSGARQESQNPTCTPPLPCEDGQQGAELGLIYRSTNRGATWSARSDPNDLSGVSAIKQLAVGQHPDTLWVVVEGDLQQSKDGGQSFTVPQGSDQANFTHTAVATLAPGAGSGGIEVVTFSTQSEMLRLQDGSWERTRVPFGAVTAVAQGPEGDIAVASAGGRGSDIWRIFPEDFIDFVNDEGLAGGKFKTTFGWENINPSVPLPDEPMVSAGDVRGGLGSFYLRQAGHLYRFLGSRARQAVTDPASVSVGAIPPPVGVISPRNYRKELELGDSVTVDYELTLPPAPTPIDVFLLVDNSGSMSPFIESLKEDLGKVALALNAAKIDVWMGVGQINVQPDSERLPVDDPRTPDVDESKPKRIYQRLRPVLPIKPELFTALRQFDGNAGSGSEPQLEALYQAATGEGMKESLTGSILDQYRVLPGQGAEWREELSPIKVIVHATDEEFSTNIKGEKVHNDWRVVAQTLADANIKQIGLSQGVPEARDDLEKMAKATGAVAPPGGTDCDGDGVIGEFDVKSGGPLVCGQSFGLEKTLVNLIRSLRDPETISLLPSGTETLAKVSRQSFSIDAKQSTAVTFKVTYTCAGVEPGRYVNTFKAGLRGRPIADATATIVCGGLDEPPQAGPQRPQPPQLAEGVSNPPPPQPQPIAPGPVPVNPVPQPQTQPQTQTQVNPQGGMADQEEQSFQLAAAENDFRDEEQLAMVGLSYEDAPGVVLALGMTMTAAAGAVAFRRRSRTATARVTVRR